MCFGARLIDQVMYYYSEPVKPSLVERIGNIVPTELNLLLIFSVASGSTCDVSSDDALSNRKRFQLLVLWLKRAIKILNNV